MNFETWKNWKKKEKQKREYDQKKKEKKNEKKKKCKRKKNDVVDDWTIAVFSENIDLNEIQNHDYTKNDQNMFNT